MIHLMNSVLLLVAWGAVPIVSLIMKVNSITSATSFRAAITTTDTVTLLTSRACRACASISKPFKDLAEANPALQFAQCYVDVDNEVFREIQALQIATIPTAVVVTSDGTQHVLSCSRGNKFEHLKAMVTKSII